MLIPIFTNNDKGITPKKLSKSKLNTTYILLGFSMLLGMPMQGFIDKDSHPIIFFFVVVVNVISIIFFMINLLTLYRHWKWVANNSDKNS